MSASVVPAATAVPLDERHELPTPGTTRKAPPLTVVADGSTIGGSVTVTGDLRVDGTVEGELVAAGGGCEVGPQGALRVALVRAVTVVVHGTVHAREVVARRVVVMGDGALHADLVIAEGVEVEDGGALLATLDVGRGSGV